MKIAPKNIKAFTLIELLVVVLIIGILAAIALPQYQIAVQKSKIASILPLIKSVDSAQQIYKLSRGTYAQTFDDLMLEMPAGGVKSGTTTLNYPGYHCFLYTAGDSVYCVTSTGVMIEKYYISKYFICWAPNDKEQLLNICRVMAAGTDSTVRKNGAGTASGYNFY